MIREGFFSPDPSVDRGFFLGGCPLISLSKRHTTLGSVLYRLSRRHTFPSPPWQPTATGSLGLWNLGSAGPVGVSLRRPCHLNQLIQTSGGSKPTGDRRGKRTQSWQTNRQTTLLPKGWTLIILFKEKENWDMSTASLLSHPASLSPSSPLLAFCEIDWLLVRRKTYRQFHLSFSSVSSSMSWCP